MNYGDKSILHKYSARKGNFGQEKPLISPLNLAQISNPRTVLKSARSEDSKTPPECWNLPSFGWDIWGFPQMVSFFKISSKMIKPRRNLMISKNFVSGTIN